MLREDEEAGASVDLRSDEEPKYPEAEFDNDDFGAAEALDSRLSDFKVIPWEAVFFVTTAEDPSALGDATAEEDNG